MDMKRRTVLSSSIAVATAALFGLKPEHVLAAEGGTLRLAMSSDLGSLDPGYFTSLPAEIGTLFCCMPSLARPRQDANGTWGWEETEFCETLEQVDDLTIKFALKPGFQWSDGAGELTAEDVKFSFERMIGSDWGGRFDAFDHVEVTGTHSGTIKLKTPYVAIWMVALAYDSGFILPKKAVEALPDGRLTTSLPAQLGPYRFQEWIPQQKTVLVRNPDWTGTPAAFDSIEFVMVADSKAGELALQAGELDIAGLLPETAANFDAAPYPNTSFVNIPGTYYQWIGLNTEHPKLADLKVRQAIQRGIDVESCLAAAYSGLSPVATGIVPVGILGHRAAAGYSYDPAAAASLLAEAGVSGLTLTLHYNVSNNEDAVIAQVVQANLADIGVTVELMPVDSGVYWNLGIESKGDDWKNLQLTIMAFRTGPDPLDAMQWFPASQYGVWNWERWKDDEFETLWTAAIGEKDVAKRGQMYERMQEIMENTGGYVWITYPAVLYGVSTRVKPAFYPGGDYRAEEFALA
jgi:peptide/nickel transport system substrate-binding protein